MKLEQAKAIVGCKYYKMVGKDDCELIRVMDAKQQDAGIGITYREESGKISMMSASKLINEYTKLIPDGVISFVICNMTATNGTKQKKYKDILVFTHTSDDINNKRTPSVICRQNIIDINYLMSTGEANTDYVGACVSRNDFPNESNYNSLTMANSVDKMWSVNFYITDTILDIVEILGSYRESLINKVLEDGFQEYLKSRKGFDVGQKSMNGHCRDLKTLLEINNYQYTHDQIMNILPVKISVEDYLEHVDEGNGIEYDKLNKELTSELEYLFGMKISRAIAIVYDHDIDLTKIPTNSMVMLRDDKGKVWLIKVTAEGKFSEAEYDAELMKQYASDVLLVNKYGSGKRA